MPSQSQSYATEDISSQLLATALAFFAVETLLICLMWLSRWCARKDTQRKNNNVAIEVFMTVAYVVCCLKIGLVMLMISIGGTGHHTSTLPPSTRSIALKLAVGTKIICPMSTSFSKLGVLVFLHRILRHAGRGYHMAIRTTFVAISMTVLAQFVYPFVNCRPLRKTWIPQTPGVCSIEDLDLWRYAGIPNTVTTVMVVAIPLPAMVKLQVSREVRFGLGVVFAVCVAGLVAAFMRFYSFLMVTSSHDITYENVRPMCWIVAESGTYLIAGVMLTLRPMLGKMWKATAVEKMWVGSGSRSWGSIRVSRKQSRRQALEVTPNIRTQQSLSVERKDSKLQQSLSMERKDILLPDIPRVYRTSEHWFEKSAKL